MVMKSPYASGNGTGNLERQIGDYVRLREARNGLYRAADEMVGGLMERMCPDIASKPIYELQRVPSRVMRCLKVVEESGISPTVDNLSRLTPSQVASLMKKKDVGRRSLELLAEALKKYGVKLDVTAATGRSAYPRDKTRIKRIR